jgi:preprotein translocase subunit YajC
LVTLLNLEHRYNFDFSGRETRVASASDYQESTPVAAGRPTGPNANQVAAHTSEPARPAADHPPQQQSGPGLMFMLMLFLPLFFLLFWMPRSQQKKQAAALSKLQKGDRVVTHGGMLGKLVEMGERTYKLEISPGVKIDVLKSSIAGKDGADVVATDKK